MIVFDGHDFESLFTVGDYAESAMASTPTYEEVSSRDGVVVKGTRISSSQVSFRVLAQGSHEECRFKFAELGKWLDVDGPRRLVLPWDPGKYYMAVPDGKLELVKAADTWRATVAFTVVEPAAYGTTRTLTVPSGGSAAFRVGGTYRTRPAISAAAAVRNQTSLVWGLRLDEGDFVHVATGAATARVVTADCEARTCTVAGAVALPTLDSDWLELEPGEHVLRMDHGTGAATVSFVERWL